MNANGIHVVLIGGELRRVSGAATGFIACYCIRQINADIAFVGTHGFEGAEGPCVENFKALVKYADWKDLDGVMNKGVSCKLEQSAVYTIYQTRFVQEEM